MPGLSDYYISGYELGRTEKLKQGDLQREFEKRVQDVAFSLKESDKYTEESIALAVDKLLEGGIDKDTTMDALDLLERKAAPEKKQGGLGKYFQFAEPATEAPSSTGSGLRPDGTPKGFGWQWESPFADVEAPEASEASEASVQVPKASKAQIMASLTEEQLSGAIDRIMLDETLTSEERKENVALIENVAKAKKAIKELKPEEDVETEEEKLKIKKIQAEINRILAQTSRTKSMEDRAASKLKDKNDKELLDNLQQERDSYIKQIGAVKESGGGFASIIGAETQADSTELEQLKTKLAETQAEIEALLDKVRGTNPAPSRNRKKPAEDTEYDAILEDLENK